jgi:hypothetical protein
MISKIFAGVFVGFLIAILGIFSFSLVATTLLKNGAQVIPFAFFGFWLSGLTLAMTAETGAKAWGRVLIASGLLCFCLPLASLLMTAGLARGLISQAGANAPSALAGVGLGGGLVAGIVGFFALFPGTIFLVLGFLIGRDRPQALSHQSTVNFRLG